jgi:hypothetical protein
MFMLTTRRVRPLRGIHMSEEDNELEEDFDDDFDEGWEEDFDDNE